MVAGRTLTLIQPGQLVLIVGPNNSGKSRALREIESWGQGNNNVGKVIAAVEVHRPTTEVDAITLLKEFERSPAADQVLPPNHLYIGAFKLGRPDERLQEAVNLGSIAQLIDPSNTHLFRQWLVQYHTARLDGRSRFLLADPQPMGDLLAPATNHLWALFQNDRTRKKVREMTEKAFNLHFVIDPTAMSQFRVRMSRRKPLSNAEEQSLDSTARTFHQNATLLGELGDGVQAFTGLIAGVMSLPHKLLLVDEPEAFLHPPLARRLGANLASIITDRNATLIAATHSADFVMGCLESNPSTSVVRLTFEGGIPTARALSPSDLQTLLKDPLVRSTGALRAMFHRGVVVTEAEKDRAFYDEINRRMQNLTSPRGATDSLFVQAQNWQTTHRITAPLRRLGIPAAIVLDIDTIADGSSNSGVWQKIYKACFISIAEAATLESDRCAIGPLVQTVSRDVFKAGGVASLPAAARVIAESHIRDLATYGIFVVPVGEVECWLSSLGAVKGKSDWLEAIFIKMGADPAMTGYVFPGVDDVWAFLDSVALWIANPSRRGMS